MNLFIEQQLVSAIHLLKLNTKFTTKLRNLIILRQNIRPIFKTP
jgi:hypothetical protein